MPISGKTVLLGKLLMVCRLQMPLVAVSVLALCLIVGCGIGLTGLTVCVCVLFCWFVGTLGLVMNLLAPRFDWQSENQPCKQSLSVCVTMFGAYFFAAVIVGVFFAGICTAYSGHCSVCGNDCVPFACVCLDASAFGALGREKI